MNRDQKLYYIKQNYKNPDTTLLSLGEALKISRNTISNMLDELDIKEEYYRIHPVKKWTKEEEDFVKENFGTMSVARIAEKLNKGVSTIYVLAEKLGLKSAIKLWTEEEELIIEDNYKDMTYLEMESLLPGRTASSIQQRANKLGLKKEPGFANWTEEEISFLKEKFYEEDYESLAVSLGRTARAVSTKAWELKLNENKVNRIKLKKVHLDFIRDNYLKLSDASIAEKLNVSESAIRTARHEMDLHKTSNTVKGPTGIEKKIASLLDELKISYRYDKYLGDYKPDFYIQEFNLIIEVHGDYFHCNPYLYPNGPKDEIQVKHVLRDYYKKCFYLSRGYTVMYLWEKDINDDFEKIKTIVTSAVSRQIS